MVFGTRPEALKMAPIVLAMREADDFTPVVAVTAQHREMLDQVLDQFGIVPDFDLDVQRPGQTLPSVTARVLEGLVPVLEQSAPDLVMVQGDTTSTFAGALAGFYHHVPVAHVEAGLRSGDLRAPYPEEMNRKLDAQLSDLHLAPTASARGHLLSEGVATEKVVVTGNTIIDALLFTAAQPAESAPRARDDDERRVVLVTLHRRESWGEKLAEVASALADVARAEPDVRIVIPLHRNPVVRDAVIPRVDGLANIEVIEPLPYRPFVELMQQCTLIVTDSGGIQEEGPSLGKPVLVVRDTTERPEAIEAGTARLVGTDRDRVRDSVLELLRDAGAYERMATAVNPYGDGRAAARTLVAVRMMFGEVSTPDEFRPRDA